MRVTHEGNRFDAPTAALVGAVRSRAKRQPQCHRQLIVLLRTGDSKRDAHDFAAIMWGLSRDTLSACGASRTIAQIRRETG